jgi:hypothetical protein
MLLLLAGSHLDAVVDRYQHELAVGLCHRHCALHLRVRPQAFCCNMAVKAHWRQQHRQHFVLEGPRRMQKRPHCLACGVLHLEPMMLWVKRMRRSWARRCAHDSQTHCPCIVIARVDALREQRPWARNTTRHASERAALSAASHMAPAVIEAVGKAAGDCGRDIVQRPLVAHRQQGAHNPVAPLAYKPGGTSRGPRCQTSLGTKLPRIASRQPPSLVCRACSTEARLFLCSMESRTSCRSCAVIYGRAAGPHPSISACLHATRCCAGASKERRGPHCCAQCMPVTGVSMAVIVAGRHTRQCAITPAGL